jgi:hypothetical protein
MDELQLLSELLPPAPSPSPEVTAAVRARLTVEPPPRLRLIRPRLIPPRLTRLRLTRTAVGRRWPRGWLLTAGAATAAAALGVVTLTYGGTAAPTPHLSVFRLPAGTAGAGTSGPGRRILLTAAKTVAQGNPAATGLYWESPAVAGNFIPVGPGDDHYLILETTTNDQFMASKPHAWSPQVVQQLSVQLASPADRAAWLRAGSPTTWHVNQEFGLATPQGPSAAEMYAVTTGRDRLPFDLGATSGDKPFVVGNASLSARQLLALPADPARLRRLLLAGDGAGGWPGGASSYLFQTVPAVLDLPVTPAVRSALYRMLAALPGVRGADQVRDVAGQTGPAVTLTDRVAPCGRYSSGRPVRVGTIWQSGVTRAGKHFRRKVGIFRPVGGWMFRSCSVQQRLIINPASGLPMAQELRYVRLPAGQTWSAPGGLFSYEIFGTPHWTGSLPRRNPRGR